MFIVLTNPKREKIAVNSDTISAIIPLRDGGSRLYPMRHDTVIDVVENVETVYNTIKAAEIRRYGK